MFERFSDHSRIILTQVSKKAAFDMKSREVRPEHVLLAIDEDAKSVGSRIIGQTVPEGEIRKEITELSKDNVNGDFKESDVHLSVAVEKLMDVAMGEADMLGDATIGTEHLLLGILKEPSGDARSILDKVGITYETVRKLVESIPADSQAAAAAQKKLQVREVFAVVYFDSNCTDKEVQLNLMAVERLKGVAMTHVMKMNPEDVNPEKAEAAKPKIILPGQY